MKKDNKIRSVGIIGMIANFFLLSIKFVIGFIFKSQGLLADAINSFGDVFSSILTYVGGKISAKPEDSQHEFGHGKAEYVASMFIGLFMMIVSIDMIYNSIQNLIQGKTFVWSIYLVIVPIVTIIVKLILYIYVKKIALTNNSLLIKANAIDHRNDCIISMGVLIGIFAGLAGLYFVDAIVGIIISIIILISGGKIVYSAYEVLIDRCIDVEIVDDIRKYIEDIPQVEHVDSIKSKPTGSLHMLIVKISVDGNMTVNQSHKIAGIIREKLCERENIYDVVVHVNPA